jgi:hypothetical protein
MEKALMSAPPLFTTSERKWLCRLTFTFILLSLFYSFISHTLVHQMVNPVLRYPYVNPSFWLLILSGIPGFISGHPAVSLLFDISLAGSCILVLVKPDRRFLVLLFFILYSVYFSIYNIYGAEFTNYKVGILLAPIPFMVKAGTSFNFLWEGLRYLTLFAYGDAFLWKLFRGTWHFRSQGVLVIKKNLSGYLYFNPDTNLAHLYYWLLRHDAITDLLFKTGFFLEGLFLLGFITRRFDKLLFLVSLVLQIGFYLFADLVYWELLILSLTLLDWPAIFRQTPFSRHV